MLSTISKMHHEIFIKLDFFNNTQTVMCVTPVSLFLSVSLQLFCQDHFPGGHLASITSHYIHKEVMNMMLRQNGAHTRTWIGGLRYLQVCMVSQGVKLKGHNYVNNNLAFTNHIMRVVYLIAVLYLASGK